MRSSTVPRRPPFFSIVLATYNRGDHIRPTIASVLRQTFDDYELLVVGDGCDDRTERAVRSFHSPKIAWWNLPQNSGSQSAPNNAGIGQARGAWIAYLGHDDVWAPDHLAALHQVVASDATVDLAVSGCFYYGPEGSHVYLVTGLFEDEEAPLQHFFPPSSLAHRRRVAHALGGWRDPRTVAAPVDADFLLRAARAGLRFRSTGQITVHKFAAGHRYLSYLRPSSDEQWAMLRACDYPNEDRTLRLIAAAKQCGGFMSAGYPDFAQYAAGQLFAANRTNKGLHRPALQPLVGRTRIEQTGEPRGLDWHGLEQGRHPCRWSGPNPHPRILMPWTGGWVRVALHLASVPPGSSPDEVTIMVDGRSVGRRVERDPDGTTVLAFAMPLRRRDYTIVTLHTPTMWCPDETLHNGDRRRLGVAIGDLVIEPLTPRERLARWLHLRCVVC